MHLWNCNHLFEIKGEGIVLLLNALYIDDMLSCVEVISTA